MKNYKMIIQYDGTRYHGWQVQGNTKNTIQEKIQQILTKMSETDILIYGSGRTDAGVHAKGQVANMHMETEQSCDEIKQYLNKYLPDDIAIQDISVIQDRFHSRLNAKGKIYRYLIDQNKKKDVFSHKYIYGLGQNLDLKAMRKAAEFLCGTHDFKSFCSNKSMKKSTVRTLCKITIKEEQSLISIFYEGNGFLQHMVRIMTGTLIEIGLGQRNAQSMPEIIESQARENAGFTAPSEGLCLMEVFY